MRPFFGLAILLAGLSLFFVACLLVMRSRHPHYDHNVVHVGNCRCWSLSRPRFSDARQAQRRYVLKTVGPSRRASQVQAIIQVMFSSGDFVVLPVTLM